MGVEYDYLSEQMVSVADALLIRDRLKAAVENQIFEAFFDFEPGDESYATVKAKDNIWPDLLSVNGFTLKTSWLVASVPRSFGKREQVLEMMQAAKAALPHDASLSIACDFEEVGSIQKPSRYDSVRIQWHNASTFFGYYSSSSRIYDDAAYRREVFQDMISTFDLPLTLHQNEQGKIEILHTIIPKKPFSTGSSSEPIPREITCVIPGETVEGMVSRLEKFLEQYAKPDKRRWSWSVSSDLPADTQGVYKWVMQSGFPMTRADNTISYMVETIEAVDGLKVLAGKKGDLDTQLYQVKFTEDETEGWADFRLRTTTEGHRLLVEFHHHEPRKVMPRIQEALGMELKRI